MERLCIIFHRFQLLRSSCHAFFVCDGMSDGTTVLGLRDPLFQIIWCVVRRFATPRRNLMGARSCSHENLTEVDGAVSTAGV